MATKDEIIYVQKQFHRVRPQKALESISKNDMGFYAAIRYLHMSDDEVNAVDISKFMEISSARMAILLKKLESKGLIEKGVSKKDARAVSIKLSPEGIKLAEEMREHMHTVLGRVIDEIGFSDLKFVLETLERIKEILNESLPEKMEEHHA